jgi:hypothetical protein
MGHSVRQTHEPTGETGMQRGIETPQSVTFKKDGSIEEGLVVLDRAGRVMAIERSE